MTFKYTPLQPYKVITEVIRKAQPYLEDDTKKNLAMLLMMTQGQESNFGRDSAKEKNNLYGITDDMYNAIIKRRPDMIGFDRGNQWEAAKLALDGYLNQKGIGLDTIDNPLERQTSWAKNWNTRYGASRGDPNFVREEFRF